MKSNFILSLILQATVQAFIHPVRNSELQESSVNTSQPTQSLQLQVVKSNPVATVNKAGLDASQFEDEITSESINKSLSEEMKFKSGSTFNKKSIIKVCSEPPHKICYTKIESGYYYSGPITIGSPFNCLDNKCSIRPNTNVSLSWKVSSKMPMNLKEWKDTIMVDQDHLISYDETIGINSNTYLTVPGSTNVEMIVYPRVYLIETLQETFPSQSSEKGKRKIFKTLIPAKLPNGYLDGYYALKVLKPKK